jgi:hypothetical protein
MERERIRLFILENFELGFKKKIVGGIWNLPFDLPATKSVNSAALIF